MFASLTLLDLILQASLWRAEGKNQGWLGGSVAPDPAKMASRIKEKKSSVQRCAQLGSGARLKDIVHTIDSEAGSTVAVLLHPFRPLLTSVDGTGTVRVHNYRHSTVLNRFHVTGAASAGGFLLCAVLNDAGLEQSPKQDMVCKTLSLQRTQFACTTAAGSLHQPKLSCLLSCVVLPVAGLNVQPMI